MATTEIEKRIRQLEPKYLQELAGFIEYLLFVQKKQKVKNGKAQTKPTEKTEMSMQREDEIPERLRIARQFAGDAPYPNFPTSKYDVYEQ